MHGLIVKFITHQGRRDEFIRIMSDGFQSMEGCHSYIIAADTAENDAVWVTEVWDSAESHAASMASARIQEVVSRAKPLMSRRDMRVVTEPQGGQGL